MQQNTPKSHKTVDMSLVSLLLSASEVHSVSAFLIALVVHIWLACDIVEHANVCVSVFEEVYGGGGSVCQGLWATYHHLGGMTLELRGFRGNCL